MALELNPDIEARLVALARDNGVSVEAFLRHVVEEKSRSAPGRRLSPEDWRTQFEEWANSFPDAPCIPGGALSRGNLYPDR